VARSRTARVSIRRSKTHALFCQNRLDPFAAITVELEKTESDAIDAASLGNRVPHDPGLTRHHFVAAVGEKLEGHHLSDLEGRPGLQQHPGHRHVLGTANDFYRPIVENGGQPRLETNGGARCDIEEVGHVLLDDLLVHVESHDAVDAAPDEITCFLAGARAGLAAGLGGTAACLTPAPMSAADRRVMAGLRVLDAHAHPYQFYTSVPDLDPTTPTVEGMIDAHMVCCAWAAVGDLVYRRSRGVGSAYVDTVNQLAEARSRMRRRGVRLVTKAADIPPVVGPGRPPGAILAIEGGDALEGRLANLDRFYAQGRLEECLR